MNRRSLPAMLLGVAALASCATSNTGNGTVTVATTLENIQAEANAILVALEADAPALIADLSSNQQATANQALDAVKAAVTALLGISPTATNVAAYVTAFIQAALGIVAILPLPPDEEMAIQAGLILAAALVNGLSSVTVTVPPATQMILGTAPRLRGLPPAPIPIPRHTL
jgi:hypothetical protein